MSIYSKLLKTNTTSYQHHKNIARFYSDMLGYMEFIVFSHDFFYISNIFSR